MDAQKKRDALRLYFAPLKLRYAIGLLALGIIGIVVFLTDPNDLGVCGGIGLLIAFVGLLLLLSVLNKKRRVPGDAQVDDWFQEDVGKIVEKALNKVGLTESQLVREAIPVTGPIFWGTHGVLSDDLLWKKGKDEIVRFSVNRVTIIFLSDFLLAAYACDFNFLKGVSLNESTQEYHYRDVVSVSTQEDSTSYTLPTGVSMVHSQAFRLSVASGEAIKVTIGASKLAEITGGTILTTSAEKAVQVIRTMLREKKS